MTTTLTFSAQFHGPFRVATGQARPGVDAAVDITAPLPATSLKGLTRHAARVHLGLPEDLVAEVFGSPSHGSVWWWSDAEFAPGSLHRSVQAQVRIDPITGTAAADQRALMFGEQLWAKPGTTAMIEVQSTAVIPNERRVAQVAAVIGSMCSVHALGSSRRRGLGTVTIRLASAHGPGTEPFRGEQWAQAVAKILLEMTVTS